MRKGRRGAGGKLAAPQGIFRRHAPTLPLACPALCSRAEHICFWDAPPGRGGGQPAEAERISLTTLGLLQTDFSIKWKYV